MNHSLLDILRGAIAHYGYWAVGGTLLLENAGVPLPGETVLLLASFLAYSEQDLQLPWLIAVATLAATLGDNLGYALGRHGGRGLLERYRSLFRIQQGTLVRSENLFTRYGPVTIFFARFVFGLRIIAGPLAGVLRMPWRRFLLFNLLGAAVWVVTISGVGYLFGQHWSRLEQNIKRIDVALAIVVALIAAFLWWRNRRVSAPGHPPS
jgi:membrane protein DedA with SNARE-associated domain